MRLIDADKLGTAIHDKMKSLPIGLDTGVDYQNDVKPAIIGMNMALVIIQTIPTYNPWISIRDHEPPKGRPLILFSRTYVDDQPAESFFIGEYRGDQFMANTLRAIPKCEIAYWMLLPETPEE